MCSWLAHMLELQGGVFPIILQAYRIGAQHSPKRQKPRNGLVAFGDEGLRNDILLLARNKGTLQCQDDLLVFPDIPTKDIQIHRRLKKTTEQLKEATCE